MCRSPEHAKNRARLALRIADVLLARNIDPDLIEHIGPGGRHVVAQLANPGVPARKVDTPSEETWAFAIEIARHAVAKTDAGVLDAMGFGR